MHCDHVFDILTQGPFPTGQPIDVAVERHLACCHECHQLAEALRPAVDLFHESISDAGSDRLPEYRGPIDSPSNNTLPETVHAWMETPSSSAPGAAHPRAKQGILSRENTVAAALVMLIAVGAIVGIQAIANSAASAQRDREAARSTEDPTTFGSSGPTLAQLQLSEACFKTPTAAAATSASKPAAASGAVQCCTMCHNAANPHRPRIDSIARLEKSCRGCHTP